MKKILFLLAAMAAVVALSLTPVCEVKAQSTTTVSKSIEAADTITWSAVGSHVRGFQYTATKTTGTVAGKVYLEGTINGTYVLLDSMTLADVATAQTKVFPVTVANGTTYKGYRFRNTNTSSATIAVVASYLRRIDE